MHAWRLRSEHQLMNRPSAARARVLVGLGLPLALLWISGAACSASDQAPSASNLDAAPTPDAGEPRDGALGDPRGTPVACAPQPLGDFHPTFPPPLPAHADVCTDSQLSTIVTNCVFAAVTSLACKDAMAAAPSCASCVLARPESGVSAAFIHASGLAITVPNVATCIAIVENDAGPTSCAATQSAYDQCTLRACAEVCSLDRPADAPKFSQCVTDATKGACAPYVEAGAAACAAAGGALDGGDDAGGSGGGGPFGDGFAGCDPARVTQLNKLAYAAFFCGAPVDGGGQ